MRLIPLTVSIHGSFGPEATRFLSDLGKRSGGGVPVSLLDSASWACPRFAPFIRMAVSHAVRRSLAEAVLQRWRHVRDPADAPSGQGAPPAAAPPPPPPFQFAPIPLPDGMTAPPAVPRSTVDGTGSSSCVVLARRFGGACVFARARVSYGSGAHVSFIIDGVSRVFSRLTAPNGLEPPKGCFAIPGISCPPRLTQQIRREA